MKQNEDVSQFKKSIDNIYVWKKKDGVMKRPAITKNKMWSKNDETILSISTVENQKKNNTHSQIKDTNRARKFHAQCHDRCPNGLLIKVTHLGTDGATQMGYINEDEMIKMT